MVRKVKCRSYVPSYKVVNKYEVSVKVYVSEKHAQSPFVCGGLCVCVCVCVCVCKCACLCGGKPI